MTEEIVCTLEEAGEILDGAFVGSLAAGTETPTADSLASEIVTATTTCCKLYRDLLLGRADVPAATSVHSMRPKDQTAEFRGFGKTLPQDLVRAFASIGKALSTSVAANINRTAQLLVDRPETVPLPTMLSQFDGGVDSDDQEDRGSPIMVPVAVGWLIILVDPEFSSFSMLGNPKGSTRQHWIKALCTYIPKVGDDANAHVLEKVLATAEGKLRAMATQTRHMNSA